MSKLFVLTDKSVREVRRNHPALKGRKLIGKGQFSGVFESDKPDTVLKLSIDRASYIFHTKYLQNLNAHNAQFFSRVIADYGIVGHFTTSKNVKRTAISQPLELNAPMYLYEVERLKKLNLGSESHLLARRIHKYYSESFSLERTTVELIGAEQRFNYVINKLLEHRDLNLTKCGKAFSALASLRNFLDSYEDSFADLHGANFMQRENGDFVFSDPVGDKFIYDCHHTTADAWSQRQSFDALKNAS